ncbi:tumor protein p63-regulated gene 1-like protein isoform X3 [Rhipicephalus microplus]|uniref:tumor protein p63-regulated gene 1-like protein isoform X3 n=1 Tax=Rhipicephalus microplus TaxID=6941 RepID=UPI003F6D9849
MRTASASHVFLVRWTPLHMRALSKRCQRAGGFKQPIVALQRSDPPLPSRCVSAAVTATYVLSECLRIQCPTQVTRAKSNEEAVQHAGSLDGNSGSAAENVSTASSSSIARQFSRELSEEETKEYFSVREGAVEKAAEQCSPVLMKHLDGELRGVWLLTEIDHWDTEKERLLFLTDYSLIVLKYDFITLKLLEYRRLHLKTFDVVQVGLLTYPNKSLMPPRNQEGVRCIWDQGSQLPVLKEWNPWCREIPWVTFTSHHLRTTSMGSSHHDVGLFSRALAEAVTQLDVPQAPPASLVRCTPCRVLYEPIVVCSYLGVAAAFHNTTQLGFFKARGKVSF